MNPGAATNGRTLGVNRDIHFKAPAFASAHIYYMKSSFTSVWVGNKYEITSGKICFSLWFQRGFILVILHAACTNYAWHDARPVRGHVTYKFSRNKLVCIFPWHLNRWNILVYFFWNYRMDIGKNLQQNHLDFAA